MLQILIFFDRLRIWLTIFKSGSRSATLILIMYFQTYNFSNCLVNHCLWCLFGLNIFPQWSCRASGSLWETPHSIPGPRSLVHKFALFSYPAFVITDIIPTVDRIVLSSAFVHTCVIITFTCLIISAYTSVLSSTLRFFSD